jgi:hypothetical protein
VRVPLRGLDPRARYRVVDADGGRARTVTGDRLAFPGLPAALPRGGAAVFELARAGVRKKLTTPAG